MLKNNTLLFFLFICFCGFGQEQSFWKEVSELKTTTISEGYINNFKTYEFNIDGFKTYLKNNPKTISLPDATGKLVAYKVEETQLLHPELAKKYPNKRTYNGIALNNSSQTVKISITNSGLHAAIYKAGKTTEYINPTSQDKTLYAVFKRSKAKMMSPFQCFVQERVQRQTVQKKNTKAVGDLKLRVFELALATTGEYSQYHINLAGVSNGTETEKKAAVLDAVIVTMNRVNGIFERDLGVTMQLIPNTDLLFYLDGNSDPYTNNDGSTMLNENQTNIDAVIGAGNYDIGHVFSTGGGGIASLFSPCGVGKARGVTGQSEPIGDPFSVDYVAHEMGHQFGANHTFNGSAGSCSSNRNNTTAVEPGSGSTIMSYAGLCAPQNVQPLVNDYFNTISIQEMVSFLTSSSTNCDDEITMTNNFNVPVVNAGSDFTVPKSTPLVLKGQASDADGDAITYCWEQIDNSVIGISNPPVATQTRGAVFRSLSPSSSSDRYLPELNTVLAGDLSSTWQVLPSVGRTMDFALTVRDNVLGGGQTAIDNMQITVDENSGPFVVTSQNANEVFWAAGTQETIIWDVANTNLAPVNCTAVNILLSLDGGFTYPITLANNVLNDGSEEITVPNITSTNARIKVEGAAHMFYAVNQTSINVINDFTISIIEKQKDICSPDEAVFNIDLNFATTFTEDVMLSADNLPSGAQVNFSTTNVNSTTSVQMTVSGIQSVAVGGYTIDVVGASNSVTRTSKVNLNIFSDTVEAPSLTNPANGANNVLSAGTSFIWDEDVNAQEYLIEIASDATFASIVETATVTSNNYIPTSLTDATLYYWRVKANNLCGSSDFSETFVLVTSEIICNSYEATNVPVDIPDEDINGVNTTLIIDDNVVINKVNVTVNVTHTWMRDLIITLESPSGTKVRLLERQCRGNSGNVNMAATFNDEGNVLECANSTPVITGTIMPVEFLSQFVGESSQGNWTLNVADVAADDTGSITSWSIEVCESKAVAAVEDETFGNLVVWPNPADSEVNISFTSLNQSDTEIKLFDTLGRLIMSKRYKTNSLTFEERLFVQNISAGLYFVQISKGDTITTKRLIVF